jgi:TATA-box binding protein (TBP) (component of TFIID and TFIIIB)
LISFTQTHFNMLPPSLTTMVVLYTTGVRFNTDILVHSLPLNETLIKIEKQGVLKRGESKKDLVRRRTKAVAQPRRTTGFGHNSITLVLLSDGAGLHPRKEITVKIFQNGVFHITGVLDEAYDRDVVHRIWTSIQEACPDAILEGTWNGDSRRVVLMNYKTSLEGVTNLSRETLYNNLRKQSVRTNYEPAVYPAVKIYFPETKWIAKVFRTGNIILTGMTTAAECSEMTTRLDAVLTRALV